MNCPNREKFCILCGQFAPVGYKSVITDLWRAKYESLFVIVNCPRDWYVPNTACETCRRAVDSDRVGEKKVKYSFPVVWHPRDEHVPEECYFCAALEIVKGARCNTVKKRDKANYPYHFGLEPPIKRTNYRKHCKRKDENTADPEETEDNLVADPDYVIPPDKELHQFDKNEFSNLVRVLGLPIYQIEFLASVLKGKGLTTHRFLITGFRNRMQMAVFDSCFATDLDSGVVYCKDIERLFFNLNHPYRDCDWRFFLDSSKTSLKGVLVHIGNVFPSVPLLYHTQTEENTESIKRALRLLDYPAHKWKISTDLKIVAVLMGMKPGYCRMQCYMCKWEGRKDNLHWNFTNGYEWPTRESYEINEHESIVNEPLIDPKNIIIPPLHVKLGLVKNFIKALGEPGRDYLNHFFSKLSVKKLEEGK